MAHARLYADVVDDGSIRMKPILIPLGPGAATAAVPDLNDGLIVQTAPNPALNACLPADQQLPTQKKNPEGNISQ